MIQQLSPEEIVRRESLDKLRALGIDPFPAAAFNTNTTAREILDQQEKCRSTSALIPFVRAKTNRFTKK
jgi:hypothetical protein